MGALEKGTSRYNTGTKTLLFTLYDEKTKESIPVSYTDVKPANFEDAVSIVAIGRYDKGVFAAEKLLVKCPSKYQGEEIEKQYGAAKKARGHPMNSLPGSDISGTRRHRTSPGIIPSDTVVIWQWLQRLP